MDYPSEIVAFTLNKEADIFIPEAKFLRRFIAEARRNRSIQALAQAYCHYAYFDADHAEELFRTVDGGLMSTEYDFDAIRPFLALFEALLTTNHPNFKRKTAAWLARFVELVRAN